MVHPFTKGELIGLEVEASGMKGKVIDETKNTITVQTAKGAKRLIKGQHTFTFILEEKKVIVEGSLLQQRPEDRIKTR